MVRIIYSGIQYICPTMSSHIRRGRHHSFALNSLLTIMTIALFWPTHTLDTTSMSGFYRSIPSWYPSWSAVNLLIYPIIIAGIWLRFRLAAYALLLLTIVRFALAVTYLLPTHIPLVITVMLYACNFGAWTYAVWAAWDDFR